MVFYLIGPSGVGKSTLSQYASEVFESVDVTSIDNLCKGHEFDWSVCGRTLNELEEEFDNNESVILLVDIGAGTQYGCGHQLLDYFSDKKSRVISVYGNPEEVILRNPLGKDRNFDEYIKTEYSPIRQSLYDYAGHKIDVSGQSEEIAKEFFVKYLEAVEL